MTGPGSAIEPFIPGIPGIVRRVKALSQQQVVFKTKLFGGFEKKAVLNYIYQINENARQAEEKLGQQLAEVTASREELSQKLISFEEKIDRMEQNVSDLDMELTGEKSKVGELNSMVERLNGEITRQRKIIRDKDQELDTYKGRIVELASVSAKYEKASSQIGMLLIDAKTRADQMLEEAAVRSEEIIRGANDSVSHLFAELDDFKMEVEKIKASVSEAIFTIQKKVDAISESVAHSEITLREYQEAKVVDAGPDPMFELQPSEKIGTDFFWGASGQ